MSNIFTVIMPTYNRAHLLPRAINSVLSQSYSDFELLIWDDGSTDETCELIKKIRDPRIVLFLGKRIGPALARNCLAEKAKGDWLTFIDSDDEWDSSHLALRKELIDVGTLAEVFLSHMTIIGDTNVVSIDDPNTMIHLDLCFATGMLTIKRKTFLELDGFADMTYAEDTHLFRRMMAKGVNVQWIDHRTYIYHREHVDSLTKLVARKMSEELQLMSTGSEIK